MIQVFYCTNTLEYTNIGPCSGKLIPPIRANICKYTRKLYKATLVAYYIKVSKPSSICVTERSRSNVQLVKKKDVCYDIHQCFTLSVNKTLGNF